MAAILVLSPNVRLDCNVRAVRLNRSAEQRVTFFFFFFVFFFLFTGCSKLQKSRKWVNELRGSRFPLEASSSMFLPESLAYFHRRGSSICRCGFRVKIIPVERRYFRNAYFFFFFFFLKFPPSDFFVRTFNFSYRCVIVARTVPCLCTVSLRSVCSENSPENGGNCEVTRSRSSRG